MSGPLYPQLAVSVTETFGLRDVLVTATRVLDGGDPGGGGEELEGLDFGAWLTPSLMPLAFGSWLSDLIDRDLAEETWT